jgi:hypothetical protein
VSEWLIKLDNMKKLNILFSPAHFGLFVLMTSPAISCKNNSGRLTADESAVAKDSVTQMAAHIARDISTKGPTAWLDYFENDPAFFMASGGQIALRDYPTAKAFVRDTLPKMMSKINLHWKNVKVDPLTDSFATLGADFHEDIVMVNGATMTVDGYFTGTAHFDGTNWRLRNLNWAIKPGK